MAYWLEPPSSCFLLDSIRKNIFNHLNDLSVRPDSSKKAEVVSIFKSKVKWKIIDQYLLFRMLQRYWWKLFMIDCLNSRWNIIFCPNNSLVLLKVWKPKMLQIYKCLDISEPAKDTFLDHKINRFIVLLWSKR